MALLYMSTTAQWQKDPAGHDEDSRRSAARLGTSQLKPESRHCYGGLLKDRGQASGHVTELPRWPLHPCHFGIFEISKIDLDTFASQFYALAARSCQTYQEKVELEHEKSHRTDEGYPSVTTEHTCHVQ